MCKYCEEGYPKTYRLLSEISNMYAEIDVATNRLVFWTTIDAGYFGEEEISGYMEIKYCPHCGRNLEEDS